MRPSQSVTGNCLDAELADLYGHSTDQSARPFVAGDLSVITCGQATKRQLDEIAIRIADATPST
jgi:hypothetical protein